MLGVYGGFEGLIFGDVKEMDWQSVSHWANTGGSFLSIFFFLLKNFYFYFLCNF